MCVQAVHFNLRFAVGLKICMGERFVSELVYVS